MGKILEKVPVISGVLAFVGTWTYMWWQRQYTPESDSIGLFLVLAGAFSVPELLIKRARKKAKEKEKARAAKPEQPKPAAETNTKAHSQEGARK